MTFKKRVEEREKRQVEAREKEKEAETPRTERRSQRSGNVAVTSPSGSSAWRMTTTVSRVHEPAVSGIDDVRD